MDHLVVQSGACHAECPACKVIKECTCVMHDKWPVEWIEHKCFCKKCHGLIFESSAK